MALSPAATRTVCSWALKAFLRAPTMCSPGLMSATVSGARPLPSPSTNTSTSGSFEMTRKLDG